MAMHESKKSIGNKWTKEKFQPGWSWLDHARLRCFNASPIPKIVAFS